MKTFKRILSIALTVIMIFASIPFTGITSFASATAKYMWPVVGNYGVSRWNSSSHYGVDITNSGNVQNPQVISTYSGTVTEVYNVCSCTGKEHPYYDSYGNYIGMVTCLTHKSTYGNLVKVLNDDGTTSIYGHLKYNSISVKNGDRVSQGQVLGLMGDSGVSTGIHLHFEIRAGSNQASCIDLKNTSFLPANIFVNYTSPPTDGWLWVEKNVAAVGEDIKLNFNATNARSFVIGIWKDNKEYAIIDNGYSDWYTISFNESGIYSIHVACYNNLGHCDSNYVNIFVYGNLGNDFNGVILNTKTWRPISVEENNYVSLQQENRKANQVWNFTRQTDGSYIITSAYNGKVLEFYYGSNSINPVFANSSDGGYNYQRWYICSAFDGFCLLSKQDTNKNLVLDLENKSSEYGTQVVASQLNRGDSQIWSVYNQQDVQLEKPKIDVIENTSGKDTTFRWDDVYGENEYNLKIFKDGTEYKSAYLENNSYDITLPSGNYTAFVRALNYFTYTESDTVSFVVKDTTLNIFFDSNGGSCLTDSKSVTYNSTYGYLPEPTKDNCIFEGWYTEKNGGEKVTSETIVNFVSDKTIYAHWILTCEHQYISEITQQPTCTEKGIKMFTCSLCNDVYYEDVDELGHDYIGRVTEPTCIVQGFTTYECSRCDDSYTENYIDPLNHSSSSWHTAINPTATTEGLAEKRCDYCGMVLDQFTIPCLVPDYVTGIILSSEKETVEIGDTFTLNATVIPATAKNKNVIWSSRNPEIVSVDNGKVTAIKPGTTAIVAETEDGGYIDFCLVRVISLAAFNGAVIDNDRNIIYGLSSNLESVDDYLETADDSMTVMFNTSTVGTGTFINVMDNGEVIDLYEAVIFGDVNGDSWYDGMDAVLVSCFANGMLTKEDVSEAVYMAADCNHDGVMDQLDVDLLNQAGTLLANVDQSKSSEELLETSSAYVEYLDLIDQTFEIEVEDDEATEDESNDSAPVVENSIFAFISEFIAMLQKLFDFILSFGNI